MAEAIANHHLRSRGGDILAVSAGIWASDGCPTSRETTMALAAMGIEFQGRSTPLSPEMAKEATIVLCMTREHHRAVQDLLAAEGLSSDHVHLVNEHSDIADPVGSPQSVYDDLAAMLAEVVPQRLDVFLPPEVTAGDE
jgi:protein-tyrosine-phosphatase